MENGMDVNLKCWENHNKKELELVNSSQIQSEVKSESECECQAG